MKPMTRRGALTGLAGLLCTGRPTLPLAQSAYPAGIRNIKIVIPFAPGGASDVIGRFLADAMSKRWGVPAVLQHVPGASATVGIGRIAHGPIDGSEVLILSIPYVTTQFIMPALPYDPERDITPLMQLTRQPSLLCVKKDLPVNSVSELIALAKERPGKLSYASSGVGSPLHLAAELFKRMSGTDLLHVPYSGSAPAKNDLIGGHVDVMFDNAASIIGIARSGSVKALGITTPARSALAPEIPAIAEAVPGYEAWGWFGLAVKTGTPADVQAKLTEVGLDVIKEPAVVEQLAALASEPVGSGQEEFSRFLAGERKRWGSLISDLKIKI